MASNSYKSKFYPESKFGGFTDTDLTVIFFNRVNALLDSSFVVLDVGCGRGEVIDDQIDWRKSLVILKGKVRKVIGIDIDPRASTNPNIDEFCQVTGETWPVEDESIDLIVCNSVLEHIEQPELMFKEFNRVLKGGGYVCLRTPNVWHYFALFSRVIPNQHHSKVLKHVQVGRKEEDVFPTYYHCNTIPKIRQQMKANGFEEYVVYGFEPEPAYLSFSIIAYYFGILYQKFAPRFMKAVIVVFGKKK